MHGFCSQRPFLARLCMPSTCIPDRAMRPGRRTQTGYGSWTSTCAATCRGTTAARPQSPRPLRPACREAPRVPPTPTTTESGAPQSTWRTRSFRRVQGSCFFPGRHIFLLRGICERGFNKAEPGPGLGSEFGRNELQAPDGRSQSTCGSDWTTSACLAMALLDAGLRDSKPPECDRNRRRLPPITCRTATPPVCIGVVLL